jgi:hypothetical protein
VSGGDDGDDGDGGGGVLFVVMVVMIVAVKHVSIYWDRYANPRNLAAGTVKLKDTEEARKRGVLQCSVLLCCSVAVLCW